MTPTTTDAATIERLELHRVELTGYCYRMLGSSFDADDAVQETLTRAWRSLDRFEGRAALRTWLYRIASNVCFDVLGSKERRVRPMDLGGPGTVDAFVPTTLPEATWILPVPDGSVIADDADPAERAVARDSLRLAVIAALQHLPPRQRAVLLLREVLRFPAAEVAELLETSVASVNSALQRARATLDELGLEQGEVDPATADPHEEELLARYLDAFERYDIDALKELIREDAEQTMPPYAFWLRGRDEILRFWCGPGAGCRGSRLVPVEVNGMPGFAQYKDGGASPWAIQALRIEDGQVVELAFFIAEDGALFRRFGLEPTLA